MPAPASQAARAALTAATLIALPVLGALLLEMGAGLAGVSPSALVRDVARAMALAGGITLLASAAAWLAALVSGGRAVVPRSRQAVNITVDTSSPVPPFEQIRAAVAELIAVGALAPETPLPSVRQLATDLGLAAGTVQRAYTELRLAGLVCTRSRQRVVVAPLADDEHGSR